MVNTYVMDRNSIVNVDILYKCIVNEIRLRVIIVILQLGTNVGLHG